jgi:hypothetical protein
VTELKGIAMKVSQLVSPPTLALAMLLSSHDAWSQSKDMTVGDLAMLPEACTARLRGDEATKKMWGSRIGVNNFLHLHHYCFGMYFTNKAKFTLKSDEKAGYLQSARGEFEYVLRHWPTDSPYRPDAESRKKEVERMLTLIQPRGTRHKRN